MTMTTMTIDELHKKDDWAFRFYFDPVVCCLLFDQAVGLLGCCWDREPLLGSSHPILCFHGATMKAFVIIDCGGRRGGRGRLERNGMAYLSASLEECRSEWFRSHRSYDMLLVLVVFSSWFWIFFFYDNDTRVS
ncbi:hypothetical protein FRC19_000557 [Serendipita sp. 401]|nr:hypothetical protein FRC19_000557 [Serendipita sp. 401]KAG9052714.1 hypothetical protein FS842_009349 [Serendipita sp. 407]